MRNLFIANNENSILLDRNKLNRVLFKIKEEITKKKIESKQRQFSMEIKITKN